MHIGRNILLALAEEVLDMESTGKEDWCIFWQQESEAAIRSVKY